MKVHYTEIPGGNGMRAWSSVVDMSIPENTLPEPSGDDVIVMHTERHQVTGIVTHANGTIQVTLKRTT